MTTSRKREVRHADGRRFLRWADLRGADLYGADLRGADFRGAKVNWNSNELIGEILRQAAGDNPRRLKFADSVSQECDWCREYFSGMDFPQKLWACEVLGAFDSADNPMPHALEA